MTFNVGLTGGISSGKSTVAFLFQKLGAAIIDADEIAHSITKPNTYCFESIVEHFGKSVVQPDGNLDRRQLRQIVFNNTKEREWLENRLHPVIREAMKEKAATSTALYNVLVIPLLAETNKKNYKYLDRICIVETPVETQIQRTMERDNITEDEARKILSSQASNEERRKIADDIILNDSDTAHCREQVLDLNEKYRALAEKKK